MDLSEFKKRYPVAVNFPSLVGDYHLILYRNPRENGHGILARSYDAAKKIYTGERLFFCQTSDPSGKVPEDLIAIYDMAVEACEFEEQNRDAIRETKLKNQKQKAIERARAILWP